jgi:hypothetical protein
VKRQKKAKAIPLIQPIKSCISLIALRFNNLNNKRPAPGNPEAGFLLLHARDQKAIENKFAAGISPKLYGGF